MTYHSLSENRGPKEAKLKWRRLTDSFSASPLSFTCSIIAKSHSHFNTSFYYLLSGYWLHINSIFLMTFVGSNYFCLLFIFLSSWEQVLCSQALPQRSLHDMWMEPRSSLSRILEYVMDQSWAIKYSIPLNGYCIRDGFSHSKQILGYQLEA